MKRAFTSLEVKSTDDEKNRKIIEPSILSHKSVAKEMAKIPSMHEESSANSTDKKKKKKNKLKNNGQVLIMINQLKISKICICIKLFLIYK